MKPHWGHTGQETFCEQFPVGMNATGATPGRILFAIVSYGYEYHWSHAG